MWNYLLRRLILLPITLFFIILINFVIVSMAPGDPIMIGDFSAEGMRREDRSFSFGTDERYLQFREHYGLTLPVLFNLWPSISQQTVEERLWQLQHRLWSPEESEEIPFKDYEQLRITFGDQARFIMPKLLHVMESKESGPEKLSLAVRFFIRGGTRQGFVGPDLTSEQKSYNRKIAKDNQLLSSLAIKDNESSEEAGKKVQQLAKWYKENRSIYQFEPTAAQQVKIFFFETRFFRYFSRVLTLDFGTLRNDNNKTVLSEVTRRLKYSLTLSILPLIFTFFLCTFFGFLMAYCHGSWLDKGLNLIFLLLFAIPIFVVAPFLIEKVALYRDFPFTNIPFPISGFTSSDQVYENMNSSQRLIDIMMHLFLPLVAITYGSLAVESRLARTAVLEVLHQDYIRTARAKGLATVTILWKHVGRNAAVTIVTALAASLGTVLGGSLIVETVFGIDGFGKFFYDAIVNRDYNVILFSSLASAFLALMGYLVADLTYAWLDPRITLD